jgi:hypothetical protein
MEKIMLYRVRLAFPTLGAPERYQNKPENTPRWSGVALVPNGDKQKAQIDAAVQRVAEAEWKGKAAAILKSIEGNSMKMCWIDGAKKAQYDGFSDCWSLSAHRYADKNKRPLVLTADAKPIYKDDNTMYDGMAGIVYAGCYVNFQFELWAQNNAHGQAIRATLLGVQFVANGDAFGGGAQPATGDFPVQLEEGADADSLTD